MKKIVLTVLFFYVYTMTAFSFEGDFFALCEKGTPEQVREAIDAGADVNGRDAQGRTPLMLAAHSELPSLGKLETACKKHTPLLWELLYCEYTPPSFPHGT